MMNKKNLFILSFIILFLASVEEIKSQWIFEVKLIGLSTHLKKSPHSHLYKRKLDKKGLFILNMGIVLSVERFVYNDIVSVKFAQALFKDCASKYAGFTHLGVRLNKQIDNHLFSIGNGPTLFYRNDWKDLPGYVDEGLFKRKGKYQYRYFWYAGEAAYSYYHTNDVASSFTLIPGPPEFATFAVGMRIGN